MKYDVIYKECFPLMKDGAIFCNSGHFNVEISIAELQKIANEEKDHSGLC